MAERAALLPQASCSGSWTLPTLHIREHAALLLQAYCSAHLDGRQSGLRPGSGAALFSNQALLLLLRVEGVLVEDMNETPKPQNVRLRSPVWVVVVGD